MKFENKVAIITGAGSGIGKETAPLFAQEGARVVVAVINVDGQVILTQARYLRLYCQLFQCF